MHLPYLDWNPLSIDFFLHGVLTLMIIMPILAVVYLLRVIRKLKKTACRPLQYNAALISCLFNSKDDGYYVWNAENRTEFFSPKLKEMFLHDFRSFEEFTSMFEEEQALKRNYNDVLKNVCNSSELPLKTRNSELHFTCTIQSFSTEKYCNFSSVLMKIHNTSDYKIYEGKITAENEKITTKLANYEKLLNNLPFPVWKRSTDQNLCIGNKFCEEYLKVNELSNLNGKKQDLVINNEVRKYVFSEKIVNGTIHVGYGTDVTEADAEKAKLQDQRLLVRSILDNVNIPAVIYASSTRLQFFNDAFKTFWELSELDLKKFADYYDLMHHISEKFCIEITAEEHKLLFLKEKKPKLFSFMQHDQNILVALRSGVMTHITILSSRSTGELIFLYTA